MSQILQQVSLIVRHYRCLLQLATEDAADGDCRPPPATTAENALQYHRRGRRHLTSLADATDERDAAH